MKSIMENVIMNYIIVLHIRIQMEVVLAVIPIMKLYNGKCYDEIDHCSAY